MPEKVITFGEKSRLVGILCEPEGTSDASPTLGALFLNAGILHHVGPYRLYVTLARRLSEQGLATLRFDIGGLGDSGPAPNPKPDLEQIIIDAKLAMDALEQKTRVSKFLVIGLCTGAANAHRVAVADPRVVGICALSGYAYRTPRYYLHRYGPALRDPRRIMKKARSMAIRIAGLRNRRAVSVMTQENLEWWAAIPKAQYLSECKQLFGRGVHVLAVFTGGDTYYLYKDQLHDTLAPLNPGDQLAVQYTPQADHTFSDGHQRSMLIDQICTWTKRVHSQCKAR